MTYLSEDLAPGCYGSALAFRSETPACVACVFAKTCAPLHEKNLVALRERLGIKPNDKTVAKRAKVAASGGAMALTGKALELLNKIEGMNLKITESLAAGRNPFTGQRPAFMLIACHLLLKLSGGVSRDQMTMAFAKKLECQSDTADAYARLAIQILTHIGAVDVNEGLVTIRRFA